MSEEAGQTVVLYAATLVGVAALFIARSISRVSDQSPRLLDMGQCNDAYGAIQVAVGLAQAFNCSVNDLPLTLVVSWFEQKAVAVLLTLLHLGVKGIRIGPNPPAFVSPNVFRILRDKFDLQLTGPSALADLRSTLGR